jgi:Zn-dependent metalloprotease
MPASRACCCFIAPPDLLARLATEGTPEQREAAVRTLSASAALRTQRTIVSSLMRQTDVPVAKLAGLETTKERQIVYDNQHRGRSFLPGVKIRAHGDAASSDAAVNEAFDGAAQTYDFYQRVFSRDSVDDKGMTLVSSVHYGTGFDNAFWNGAQMVYGDGSGHLFQVGALTKALDVIGHELTHGVTQFTAGLDYSSQTGALNEHMSDVFGSLVKQHHLGQTAADADWLIGAGTLVAALGKALRSMRAPGTAYDGDRQPAHMKDYVDLPDDGDPRHDNGGVHINSGIPNHAFYLAATKLGGHAWEKAGPIWYTTLTERLQPNSQFADAAKASVDVAGKKYGAAEVAAVKGAWHEVGVDV